MRFASRMLPFAAATLCGIALLNPLALAKDKAEPSALDRGAQATNATGATVLGHLFKQKPTENHFISPFSIQSCLTIVRNGAAGETRTELDKALNLQGLPGSDMDMGLDIATLHQTLAGTQGVTLESANGMWSRKRAPFNTEFASRQKEAFGAEVGTLPESEQAALAKMNGWANEKTHGKIPSMLSSLSDDVALIVANAVYFKGEWGNQFDKAQTRKQTFTLADKTTREVDFMSRTGEVRGVARKDVTAISLPYKGNEVSMLLMLPAEGADMSAFVEGMTPEFLAKLRGELRFQDEDSLVTFPKFKMECTYDLVPTLRAAGVQSVFGETADLTRMTEHRVYVSFVVHKTFVEVNEEGTEAAAVTAAGAEDCKKTPFVFQANRPFAFAIIHHATGTVLFEGVLNSPS
ncbi:MAG: serpin family protein [Planctomycetes bacterium]|nr:serpin family protein [Planctomycetota bacterium]